jgi:hypothetical protein
MGTFDDFFQADATTGYSAFFATPGATLQQGYDYGLVAHCRKCGVYGSRFVAGPTGSPYVLPSGVCGTSDSATGVAGTSHTFPGVYGQVGAGNKIVPPGLLAGVLGASATQPGVIGWSRESYGVQGASLSGPGVAGTSALRPGLVGSGPVGIRGTGVFTYPTGEFGAGSGVVGVARKPGPGVLFNTAGVLGTSDVVPGVIGTSHSAIGVYGFSTGNAGVVGESVNSFAGYFAGNVVVTGNLTVGGVISPNPKLAVMPFPDGTHRALYCMESPEVWFEDFGAARLKRGRALVKIDADFAKVIKRGDYRVFVTPEGDCRGLYIRRKQATSFEVRELGGGKSSVAFSYRIVGRRKDIGRHTRFAKIDARLAKPNTRLPLPAAAAAAPRKQSKSSALRAFMAGLEKEARARAPKGVNKDPRPIPKHLLPQAIIAAKARARRKAKAGSGARQGTARKAPS